jgi:cbb3-type cytochrome oxidase cytochrome c subunit
MKTRDMKQNRKLVMLSSGVLLLMTIGCFGSTPKGAVLFKRERCIYCHTFKGQGAKIGPDLTDVTRKRTDEWLRDQIRNPKLHDPNPGMPEHEYLSRKEINAIIEYLKSVAAK